MTALAPQPPNEREYDAAADAFESWLLAISELRRQHLARAVMRDTELEPDAVSLAGYPTKAPGDG